MTIAFKSMVPLKPHCIIEWFHIEYTFYKYCVNLQVQTFSLNRTHNRAARAWRNVTPNSQACQPVNWMTSHTLPAKRWDPNPILAKFVFAKKVGRAKRKARTTAIPSIAHSEWRRPRRWSEVASPSTKKVSVVRLIGRVRFLMSLTVRFCSITKRTQNNLKLAEE